MKLFKQLPSLEVVQRYLSYDPLTGRWTWANTFNNRIVKGKTAGTVTKYGYLKIKVVDSVYMAHRLAWLWCYEQDPVGLEIDHIDGNRLNNAIDNLRVATTKQNSFNSKTYNALGLKGVSKSGSKYRARIRFNNKCLHIGVFNTALDAAAAYNAKAIELFGEFAWLNAL